MTERIQPSTDYPGYWKFNGEPTLLLGGSVEDNLFQITQVTQHLDLLARVGGNYVRCTMSSRDPGDLWPYAQGDDGLYDLRTFNDAYWQRFHSFLEACLQRNIIVQIELWDRFDFARQPWLDNPYNPKNNSNYSAAESGLKTEIDTHPGQNENRFFYTIPSHDDNLTVRAFQEQYVERLLEIALPFPNVLYCIDNETSGTPAWSEYWARMLLERSKQEERPISITEMWDAHDLRDPQHAHTIDNPHLYAFVDVSQNNHQTGQAHWDNLQAVHKRVKETPRPLNNVKVYGSGEDIFGTAQDAIERFWRNIFAGCASTRFHRPPHGLGLGPMAQKHIQAVRLASERFGFFESLPGEQLLRRRRENQAYCRYTNHAIAVYFTHDDSLVLDTSLLPAACSLQWLDVNEGVWKPLQLLENTGQTALHPPDADTNFVVLTADT